MANIVIKENVAISDTGFIFLPSTGESFTTNEIGKEILKMIQKKSGFEEIKNYILENYDIDSVTFEKDYIDFISQLNQYGLSREV